MQKSSRFLVVSQMIGDIFGISMISIKDESEQKKFCEKHRLDKFAVRLQKCQAGVFRMYENILYLRVIYFMHRGQAVIIGPYLAEEMNIERCIQLCSKLGKKPAEARELLAFYESYPVIMDTHMQKILFAVKNALGLGEMEETYEFEHSVSQKELDFSKLAKVSNENLEMHYCMEREYMDAIKRGNFQEVMRYKKLLSENAAGQWSTKIDKEGKKQALAVNRAMSRIAAFEAGVPAPLIHQISTKESTEILSANTMTQMDRACETMLREFCDAICDIRNRKYSAMVQSVIYCIHKQFGQPLSVREMAEEVGVTESYMIARFKKETGATPATYLRNVRLEEAARLLIATDDEIQKIAGKVGITDANYFVKVFKAKYQNTPKDYRKRFKV